MLRILRYAKYGSYLLWNVKYQVTDETQNGDCGCTACWLVRPQASLRDGDTNIKH
jgi:hypothetical protein